MGREKGTLNISANFEPQIAAPFDSRIVVDTYTDLTAEDTFISTDGNNYAYVGMIVSVVADADSNNNGVYLLKALPTTSAENWAGVGKGITGATPEYDDLVEYKVGDIIVYISPYAEMLEEGDPLKEEGLYECVIDTEAGENPEIAPNKWRYLGKLGETAGGTPITEIPGLQTELEDRVKYSDIGDNLIVTSNKQVNLDVTYLTVTGYSPAEDIQPSPADPTDPTNPMGEVKINNTIWKAANEVVKDELSDTSGIFPARDVDGNDVSANFGCLYTRAAVQRVLDYYNGEYRLPTLNDYNDSLARNRGDVFGPKEYCSIYDHFREISDSAFSNGTGLGLRTSGSAYTDEDTETVLISQSPANHRYRIYRSSWGGSIVFSAPLVYHGDGLFIDSGIAGTTSVTPPRWYYVLDTVTPDMSYFHIYTRIPVSEGSSKYYNVALPLRLVKDI